MEQDHKTPQQCAAPGRGSSLLVTWAARLWLGDLDGPIIVRLSPHQKQCWSTATASSSSASAAAPSSSSAKSIVTMYWMRFIAIGSMKTGCSHTWGCKPNIPFT